MFDVVTPCISCLENVESKNYEDLSNVDTSDVTISKNNTGLYHH